MKCTDYTLGSGHFVFIYTLSGLKVDTQVYWRLGVATIFKKLIAPKAFLQAATGRWPLSRHKLAARKALRRSSAEAAQ